MYIFLSFVQDIEQKLAVFMLINSSRSWTFTLKNRRKLVKMVGHKKLVGIAQWTKITSKSGKIYFQWRCWVEPEIFRTLNFSNFLVFFSSFFFQNRTAKNAWNTNNVQEISSEHRLKPYQNQIFNHPNTSSYSSKTEPRITWITTKNPKPEHVQVQPTFGNDFVHSAMKKEATPTQQGPPHLRYLFLFWSTLKLIFSKIWFCFFYFLNIFIRK